MNIKKSSKNKIIWLSVLILLICVALTTLAITKIMDMFLPNDNGAISLIPEDSSQVGESEIGESETDENKSDENKSDESDSSANGSSQTSEPEKHPGFEDFDDKTVWGTNTQVEIFKVSYENGEQIVTVKSDDGSKVIAPGTENTYTFKLKNTGDVALDCAVEMDAFFAPADFSIPITARVCRYDGKWVVGSADSYAAADLVDKAEDSMTLAAGRYIYYTLDWTWPFDNGDDALDTLLGNRATKEDLTFTIVIKTTATESNLPGGGILSPVTGVNGHTLWILLLVFSLGLLVSSLGIILLLPIFVRKPVLVTGFISESAGKEIGIDRKISKTGANGRFAFETIYTGKHCFVSGEKECPFRLKYRSKTKGIEMETEDDRLIILVGRRVRAIELYLLCTGSEPVIDRNNWAAIDQKHNVITPSGVDKPKDGQNTTPGGLHVHKNGCFEIPELSEKHP